MSAGHEASGRPPVTQAQLAEQADYEQASREPFVREIEVEAGR
jgi:hypothetical protein